MKSLLSVYTVSLFLSVAGITGTVNAQQRTPPPDIAAGTTLTVSASDGLNVRMQPNAQRIGAVPNGRVVHATGPAVLHPTGADGLQYWVPIRYQNESNEWRTGWIYYRHVTPGEDSRAAIADAADNRQATLAEDEEVDVIRQDPPSRAQLDAIDRSQPMRLTINVNRSRARFRADPSLSGSILGHLTNNTAVEVIGRPQGEWIPIRVTATGQLGWVHVSLLEATGGLNPLELAGQHADTPQRADEQIEEFAQTVRARDTEAGTGDTCDEACRAQRGGTADLERLPVPADNGNYVLPLPRGSFRLSSGYGHRHHPILRRRRMHTGWDYAAPRGTNVMAVRAGRVVSVITGCRERQRTRTCRGYGNRILIDHGGGIQTFYAHLSEVLVTRNQVVRQGEVIGKVGSTGMSTGPHLHLEVHRNGTPQNPANYGVPRR